MARRRAARRRGFLAFLLVVAVVAGALAWARSGGDAEVAATGTPSPSGGKHGGGSGDGGDGGDGGSGTPSPGAIVPGENPIEHVVFIVKENRTFNNYFATYPGAEGAPRAARSSARRTAAMTDRSFSSRAVLTSTSTT
jgi:phospholipase C